MGLLDFLLRQGLKPEVVHSLPGRLRVQIPLLKSVPPQWRPVADSLPRLLRVPEGIESVDFTPATGSLLFEYDQSALAERDVRNWIDAVVRTVIRYQDKFAKLKPADVPAVVERLEAALRGAVGRNAVVDEETLNLEGVWEG